MRFLNADEQTSIFNVQMYLTVDEADALHGALARLLRDPSAIEHEHVLAGDGLRELSVSLVTPEKLIDLSGYSKAEQAMFKES